MKPIILLPAAYGKDSTQYSSCEGCDGDCACALPASYLQSAPLLVEAPQGWQPNRLMPAVQFSTLPVSEAFSVLVAPGTASGWMVVNHAALDVLRAFDCAGETTDVSLPAMRDEDFLAATYTFTQLGFLVSSDAVSLPVAPASVSAPLEAWLFLTRACNLACAHCFISKDPRQMTRETGLAAVERLFALAKNNNHPGVKIKYAGGEPTLRWDLVTTLHEHADQLSRHHSLPLTEILVTNGAALSRARLTYLQKSNIQLSISLDGFGVGHDRQRPFVNGQPSFARIMHNLEMALDMGLRPYLTITLTRLNLDDLPALTEFALQNRLYLNWNFYRPHSAGDPLTPDAVSLTAALRKGLEVVASRLPDYPFLDRLIDRSNFGAAHQHTCGAGRHYLSIDYDGAVLPCHMLSGANGVGIPLQTLSMARFENFANPAADEKPGCNQCEWRYWCTGGCPILAGFVAGQANSRSPYCQVYKAIYPDLMALKGKQLIQNLQILAQA